MNYLGINEVRKCLPNLNARLDSEMQAKNVKGHSGRRSFITNGLNSGVPPEIIAQSTKHKDPKTLMAYAEKSDAILGSAGVQLGKKMKLLDSNDCFGGHDTRASSSSSSTTTTVVGITASSVSEFGKSCSGGDEKEKKYTLNFTFN